MDTPRSYNTSAGPASFSPGFRKDGWRIPMRFVLWAMAILLVYALWTSRNSHPMREFVSSEARIRLVITDAMEHRDRIAGSAIWQGLPASVAPADTSERLAHTFGMPEWILRNVLAQSVVVTANDIEQFEDRIITSRMTRVGALLERVNRLVPAIRHDTAGGLKLRHMPKQDLYYAVRGRTLIASPSRDALITALTLSPDERMNRKAFREMLADAGSEDIRGTVRLGYRDAAGKFLKEIRFAARIDRDEATVKLQADFQPEWQTYLEGPLGNLSPRTLNRPIPGPLAMSGDLGLPVKDLWKVLGEMTESEWLSSDQWHAWEAEEPGSVARILTDLVGPMGTGFQLTWHGVDMNELSPVMIVSGGLEGDEAGARDVFDGLAGGEKTYYREAYAYYDTESSEFHAPMLSGPSMEPTARWLDDRLLFSTSRKMAESLFDENKPRRGRLSEEGNVYMEMDPQACVEIVVKAGMELAAGGLLRDYTAEQFRRDSAIWLEKGAVLDSVVAMMAVDSTTVDLDIRLAVAADRPDAEPGL